MLRGAHAHVSGTNCVSPIMQSLLHTNINVPYPCSVNMRRTHSGSHVSQPPSPGSAFTSSRWVAANVLGLPYLTLHWPRCTSIRALLFSGDFGCVCLCSHYFVNLVPGSFCYAQTFAAAAPEMLQGRSSTQPQQLYTSSSAPIRRPIIFGAFKSKQQAIQVPALHKRVGKQQGSAYQQRQMNSQDPMRLWSLFCEHAAATSSKKEQLQCGLHLFFPARLVKAIQCCLLGSSRAKTFKNNHPDLPLTPYFAPEKDALAVSLQLTHHC